VTRKKTHDPPSQVALRGHLLGMTQTIDTDTLSDAERARLRAIVDRLRARRAREGEGRSTLSIVEAMLTRDTSRVGAGVLAYYIQTEGE